VRRPVSINEFVRDLENSTPWARLVTKREEVQIAGAAAKTPPTRGPPTAVSMTTALTMQPPSAPLQAVRPRLNRVLVGGTSSILSRR